MEIEALAQRYHRMPHEVLAAPVWVFRHARLMREIESRQGPPPGDGGAPMDSGWWDE